MKIWKIFQYLLQFNRKYPCFKGTINNIDFNFPSPSTCFPWPFACSLARISYSLGVWEVTYCTEHREQIRSRLLWHYTCCFLVEMWYDIKDFSYYQSSIRVHTKSCSICQWDHRIFSRHPCVAWISVRIFSIPWSCHFVMTLVQGP